MRGSLDSHSSAAPASPPEPEQSATGLAHLQKLRASPTTSGEEGSFCPLHGSPGKRDSSQLQRAKPEEGTCWKQRFLPPSVWRFSGLGLSRASLAKGGSRNAARVRTDSRGKQLSSWAQGPHPSVRCLCHLPPQRLPPDLALLARAVLRASGTPPPPWCSCSCGIPCPWGAEGPGLWAVLRRVRSAARPAAPDLSNPSSELCCKRTSWVSMVTGRGLVQSA